MKYFFLLVLTLAFSTCVSKKTFLASEQAAASADSLAQVQLTELRESLAHARGANQALRTTEDKLQDRLDILQQEIDRLGKNASSTQQDMSGQLRQKEQEIADRQAQIDAANRLLRVREERLQAMYDAVPAIFAEQGVTTGWELRPRNGQLNIAIGEDNLFRKNSTSAITPTGELLLGGIARLIAKYPEMQVQVVGHTDNVAVPREGLGNWQYSALRAISVVKGLTASGAIGPNRVLAASKSEYEPLESNETAEGRQRNRRVEIIIAPREADLERELRKVLGS
jgi:chemotaxis protein MotB